MYVLYVKRDNTDISLASIPFESELLYGLSNEIAYIVYTASII